MRLKENFVKLNQATRLYELSIPIIGLTGGVATGKSLATNLLKERGFHVICADTLVKKIYSFPSSFSFIQDNFSEVIKEKKIDYKILREMFFSSKKIKNKIESFIFSQMPEVFINEVKSLKSPPVIFYDVPLLFERNLQDQVDFTVCIFTSPECQRKRLIKRDKIEEGLADKIIKSQMDINQKKGLATFSLDNSKSKNEFEKNLDEFLTKTFSLT